MTQFLKIGGILVAVVAIFLLGWYLAQSNWRDPSDANVQMTPVPPMHGTRPGDPLDAEHERLRDQYEAQEYEKAAQQPGSESFAQDIRPLQNTERQQLPPDTRWQQPPADAQPTGPSEREQQRKADKTGGMKALVAKWTGYDGHHLLVYTNDEAQGDAAQTAAAEQDKSLRLPLTGKIHIATLLVGINSDILFPVVANLLKPPLAGATLTGKFTRADNGVLIEFQRLQWQGQSYTVDAYAIDLDSASGMVATHVNRRTVSRWAAVLGSALLGGLQRGVLADADVVAPGLGTVVVERDLDGEDIAAIAVGEIGRRTQPMAQEYWNRPNTVTVDEAVGVVFLSDVVVVIDTQAPGTPPPAQANAVPSRQPALPPRQSATPPARTSSALTPPASPTLTLPMRGR